MYFNRKLIRMIEYFKTNKITNNDIEHLKNINPFWAKDLSKTIKKLQLWLLKFNKKQEDFPLDNEKGINGYIVLFQQINNYRNFINQKYDYLKTNARVLKKFHKLLFDYCNILGIAKAIEIIAQFFEDFLTKDIVNKRNHLVSLSNSFIEKNLNIYKKELDKQLPNDKYIEMCFESIIITEVDIYNVQNLISNMMKYSKLLRKKQKISESIFLENSINSIETGVYLMTISNILSRFSENL